MVQFIGWFHNTVGSILNLLNVKTLEMHFHSRTKQIYCNCRSTWIPSALKCHDTPSSSSSNDIPSNCCSPPNNNPSLIHRERRLLSPIDLWNRRNCFDLDQKVPWQLSNLECRPCWLWVGKELSVYSIHGCEIRNICQHDRGLQRVLPRRTSFFEDCRNVGQDLTLWGILVKSTHRVEGSPRSSSGLMVQLTVDTWEHPHLV